MNNVFYVYQLIDPRDDSVFYVGKGKGDRLHQHVKFVKKERIDNAIKYRRIADILSSGFRVIETKVQVGMSEGDALRLEKAMIKENKETLTNISGGRSCSPIESIKLQGEIMLKQLPPFELWAKYGRKGMIEAYRNIFGSERMAYEWIKNATTEIANGC